MKYKIPKPCEGCTMATRIVDKVVTGNGKVVTHVPLCYKYWSKHEYCNETSRYIPKYQDLEGD